MAALARAVAAAPSLRVLFTVDFVYWTAFAVYQTTFALFGARRFGFDAAHTGYLLSAFGFLGVLVQGVLVGPVVARSRRNAGRWRWGWCSRRSGGAAAPLTHSLPVFVADAGARRARHRAVQRDAQHADQHTPPAPHEQGRVQGAAGALESLGRTIGPVWGNGALQLFGEGKAYGSAAVALLGAAVLTLRYRPARHAGMPPGAATGVAAVRRD